MIDQTEGGTTVLSGATGDRPLGPSIDSTPCAMGAFDEDLWRDWSEAVRPGPSYRQHPLSPSPSLTHTPSQTPHQWACTNTHRDSHQHTRRLNLLEGPRPSPAPTNATSATFTDKSTGYFYFIPESLEGNFPKMYVCLIRIYIYTYIYTGHPRRVL